MNKADGIIHAASGIRNLQQCRRSNLRLFNIPMIF
jgi:hypothetical protein